MIQPLLNLKTINLESLPWNLNQNHKDHGGVFILIKCGQQYLISLSCMEEEYCTSRVTPSALRLCFSSSRALLCWPPSACRTRRKMVEQQQKWREGSANRFPSNRNHLLPVLWADGCFSPCRMLLVASHRTAGSCITEAKRRVWLTSLGPFYVEIYCLAMSINSLVQSILRIIYSKWLKCIICIKIPIRVRFVIIWTMSQVWSRWDEDQHL